MANCRWFLRADIATCWRRMVRGDFELLHKPYSVNQLSRILRKVSRTTYTESVARPNKGSRCRNCVGGATLSQSSRALPAPHPRYSASWSCVRVDSELSDESFHLSGLRSPSLFRECALSPVWPCFGIFAGRRNNLSNRTALERPVERPGRE